MFYLLGEARRLGNGFAIEPHALDVEFDRFPAAKWLQAGSR
jgi:hypothetical protein